MTHLIAVAAGIVIGAAGTWLWFILYVLREINNNAEGKR